MDGKRSLVIVIGDLHVPHRASELPEKFKGLLQSGVKIDQILCTGNLNSREMRDYFRTITNNTVVVAGQCEGIPGLTEKETVSQGNFKIGLIHGHDIVPSGDKQILATQAANMNVDILISGHTHEFAAYEKDGRIFLNPGTATGAYSGFSVAHVPTMALLEIQGSRLQIFKYALTRKGELEVTSTEFQKPAAQ